MKIYSAFLKAMAILLAVLFGTMTLGLTTVYVMQTPAKPILQSGLVPLPVVLLGLWMTAITLPVIYCLFESTNNRNLNLFASLQLLSSILAAITDCEGKDGFIVLLFVILSLLFAFLTFRSFEAKIDGR